LRLNQRIVTSEDNLIFNPYYWTMEKPGRTFVSQSVSFPPELLAQAKARTAKLGLAFSAYVQKCIERDLTERGAIVYREQEEGVAAGATEESSPKPARTRVARRRK
jgi:post-segregation antitoxin (ccd killing protein)